MALNVGQFKDALKQVFQDGQSASNSDEVAEALAQVIHDYITAASVTGVVVNVVDMVGNPLGTGTQTTPVAVS
jgi:hypothetical protein